MITVATEPTWPDKPLMRPLTKPIHHFNFMCYSHDGAGFGMSMSEAYFEYHATVGKPVPAPRRLQIGATDV